MAPSPDRLTFTAESDSEVVGFISASPLRQPHPGFDAELNAIYLLEPWQGQGTSRRLARTLSAALLDHHLRSLLVWVLEDNAAIHFDRALGATGQHRKTITLSDTDLPEISFGWTDLASLTHKPA